MSGLCLCRVRERLEERGSQGHQMEVFSRVIKKGVGGKEGDGAVREGFGAAVSRGRTQWEDCLVD